MPQDIKCHWLLESDTIDKEVVTQLAEEIQRQGMLVKFADRVPLRSNETYVNIYPSNACVVFHGTLGFSKQIQKEAKWVPGSIHTVENFCCRNYYPHFRRYILAQQHKFCYFKELVEYKNDLYAAFSEDNTLFIRPDSGEKIFTGQLITYENFEKELERLGYEPMPRYTQVVVSSPRNIEREWRFVVVDRKVITGSSYIPFRLRLKTPEDRIAELYAQDVVDSVEWQPDRAWCLDVCRTRWGNFYVVEINSFSCSGLYASNPRPIVMAVSQVALEEWKKHHNGL